MISTSPTLYDSTNISDLAWSNTDDGDYARRQLLPWLNLGVENFITNTCTKVAILAIDNLVLPVTINDTQYENSYVCSPYTHYVSYAKTELSALKNPKLESGLTVALNSLGVILKSCRINRVVHVNNWLVSTNLYPEITADQIKRITTFLLERFPDHAIVFRSINPILNEIMQTSLVATGYHLVTGRQVYIFPHGALKQLKSRPKSILKKDFRLLENSGYQWYGEQDITESYLPRILDLYNQLYLDKYSLLNPQFNLEFIKQAWLEKTLTLFILKKDGQIDGVIGFFARNGVMTTPFFGYNLSLPPATGLYRMLSAKLVLEAEHRNLNLHQSSGAAEFKRCRGGVPCLEYNAVYTKHLSLWRRLGWSLIGFLANQVGAYLLKNFKL